MNKEKLVSYKVVKPILLMLETAINIKPATGILLVAPAGSGKSALIRKIKGEGILHIDDFTGASIDTLLAENENVRLIAVSDLNKIITRDKKTSPLSVLLNLTEEGYVGSLRYKKNLTHQPKHITFVAGITTDHFRLFKDEWAKSGLLSRTILINYHYEPEELLRINKEKLNYGIKLQDLIEDIKLRDEIQYKEFTNEAKAFVEREILPLFDNLRIFERYLAFLKTFSAIRSSYENIRVKDVAFITALLDTYSNTKGGTYAKFISSLKYWLTKGARYEDKETYKIVVSDIFNDID